MITAPRIITTGISTIDTLRVEGQRVVDHESAVDITQDYLVRDQIHLRAIHGEEGSRFALGTNSDSDSDDETELLDIIDVPTYQALSKSGPQLGDPTLNLTDVFTLKGVTRDVGGVRFTLQGLSVFMNNAGHLLVQGTQTDFTKPIFLSTDHPIILDNVRASALQITAPRIITTGISTIDTLRVEGQRVVDHESAVFVNAGQLTAREFFLKNLKGQNTGGIAATRFAVDGQLASTGSIYSSELILEEAAFLDGFFPPKDV